MVTLDSYGVSSMILLGALALAAIYIILRMFKASGNEEEEDYGEHSPPIGQPVQSHAGMSDEDFIESYTDPIMEDAMESLESGMDSIKSGLDCYGRGLWEEASNDFHIAAGKVDGASNRLKEIPGTIEDESSKPVIEAKARIAECLKLRALTIRMEEASDAMVQGKAEEAKKLAAVKNELELMVSAFYKEK